jgi:hypothetical protein
MLNPMSFNCFSARRNSDKYKLQYGLQPLRKNQPVVMGKVLGIVYRIIATHLTKKAGFTKTTSQTGAITYDMS